MHFMIGLAIAFGIIWMLVATEAGRMIGKYAMIMFAIIVLVGGYSILKNAVPYAVGQETDYSTVSHRVATPMVIKKTLTPEQICKGVTDPMACNGRKVLYDIIGDDVISPEENNGIRQ